MGDGWIAQAGTDAFQSFEKTIRRLVVEADQESVGVFGLEAVCSEHGRRKVLEIGSNDEVRFAACCRRDDMAVVGVGELDCGNEFFEARNQGVPDVRVHEPAGALEACCRDIRLATPQRTDPLVVDGIGPLAR